MIARDDTFNLPNMKTLEDDCVEALECIKAYNKLEADFPISLKLCYTTTGHVAVKEDGKIVAIPEPKAMPSPHLTSDRPCFLPWC